MKKRVILLSLILLAFGGCQEELEKLEKLLGTKKEAQATQKPMMMPPPQKVQIIVAKKQDVPLSFEYPVQIISDEDVQVRTKVSGTLLEKHFQAGEFVKKGDKLFTIDQKVYKAQLDVQNANVQVTLANLTQAKREFTRAKSLYAKKATSQKNYDSARSAYEVARASVAQARALKDSAKINLDYTEVTAPFSGTIGDAMVDVGEFMPINTPLVRLTKTAPVYAEFYIPDVEGFNFHANVQNNLWSKTNSPATIEYGGKKIEAQLTFIDKIINTQNGSVRAKAMVENKDNALPVGAFAKIKIDNFSQKNAFKIPQIALQQNLATTFIFVVGKLKEDKSKPIPKNLPPSMIPNGVVKMVPIQIDYQTDKYVLVSGGIQEGDKVIMNNFKKIYPKAKIKVVGEYGKMPPQAEKK